MRYVSIIEDRPYLIWQQEIQILNLKELGQEMTVVVLHNSAPSERALALQGQGDIRYYKNEQVERGYVPSNKPYGLGRLLDESPELGTDLFLLDSDVIFRQLPDFSEMTDPKGLYMSDCNSYLGLGYISSKVSPEEITPIIQKYGLTWDTLGEVKGGGAQYYFKSIQSDYCYKVASSSIQIYADMSHLKEEDGTYKLQVWTGEMWAWIWEGTKVYNLYTPPQLDFCWGTDLSYRWDEAPMLHLAGVVNRDMGHFYKGAYVDVSPWENPDFSYVTRTDSCAWIYLQHIAKYKGITLPSVA